MPVLTKTLVSVYLDAQTREVVVDRRQVPVTGADEPAYIGFAAARMREGGEHARALECLESGVRRFPENARLHGQIAGLFRDMAGAAQGPRILWSWESDAHTMRAAEHFAQASDLHPRDFHYALGAGEMHADLGRNDLAFFYLRRAAANNYADVGLWRGIGRICLRQGENRLAAACYRNMLRLDPRNADACEKLERLGLKPFGFGPVDFAPLGFTPLCAGRRLIGGMRARPC